MWHRQTDKVWHKCMHSGTKWHSEGGSRDAKSVSAGVHQRLTEHFEKSAKAEGGALWKNIRKVSTITIFTLHRWIEEMNIGIREEH